MTKHIGALILCLCILGLSTACSQQNSPFSSASEKQENKSSNPGSETSLTTSDKDLSPPIVAPPSYNDRPAKPGQLPPSETLPSGLPALKPLKGVNVDKLFSENISNTDDRFDRVENAVTDLRKEFEVAKPAIVRLVAVEKDIQNLVEQLEVMIQEEANRPAPVLREPIPVQQNTASLSPENLRPPDSRQPPPQAAAAESVTANQPVTPFTQKPASPPEPASTPPPVRASGSELKTIRMGDHAGKTRLVFETGQQLAYTADIDNEENLLILTFTQGSLGLNVSEIRKSSKLIKSVSATPQDKGFVLAFDLSKTSSVIKQGRITPNKDNPNHRIFIDLSR